MASPIKVPTARQLVVRILGTTWTALAAAVITARLFGLADFGRKLMPYKSFKADASGAA